MLTVCFSLTSAVCASIAASLTRPVPAAARAMVSVFPAVHCASSSLPLLVITPFHATFRFLLTQNFDALPKSTTAAPAIAAMP